VDAWHRSGIRLGMCDKNAYPEVVRMRQEAVEQPDAADGAGELERRR
jgi:hypothetical protein